MKRIFALALIAAFPNVGAAEMPPPDFVANAASSNLFEIRSSEMALEKATKPELKEFAGQMVTDHTAAGEKLGVAADGIPVPAELSAKHAEMITRLDGAAGADFDMLYTEMQVAAHDEAVTLFSTFAAEAPDGELKTFAAETLPTLEKHKEHIDAIAAH